MAEAEVTQVSIDTLPMKEFKEARSKGVLTVSAKTEAVADPEEVEEQEAEEFEAVATEEESPEEEKTAEKPKPKGGFQKRIDRLIKQTSALEQQLADERAARAALEAKGSAKPEEKKAAPSDRPARDQFATDEEYIDALVGWRLKAEKESEARAAEDARVKAVFKSYNEKLIEARARIEDFDEVVGASDVTVPKDVILAIPEMENGPDVAYFLGKNPDICAELLEMTPLKAIGMAWKISESLINGGKKEKAEEKPKLQSKAPAPIKPVTGGNSKSTVPLDQMDMRAFKEARAAGRVS